MLYAVFQRQSGDLAAAQFEEGTPVTKIAGDFRAMFPGSFFRRNQVTFVGIPASKPEQAIEEALKAGTAFPHRAPDLR